MLRGDIAGSETLAYCPCEVLVAQDMAFLLLLVAPLELRGGLTVSHQNGSILQSVLPLCPRAAFALQCAPRLELR